MFKDALNGRKNQSLRTLDVALDVGLDLLHAVTDLGAGLIRRQTRNQTEDIQMLCRWLKDTARHHGFSRVRLIMEPTGIYHELLARIGHTYGFDVRTVQAAAVKSNRLVMFGDFGKTDHRDPEVILDLAKNERLISKRILTDAFQALRNAGVIYARAESDAVRAKCRIHRALRRVFPDFPLSKDFVFSRSGDAVMKVTGFDPHAIVRIQPKRFDQRIRRLAPRIRRSSITSIHEAAKFSAKSSPSTRATELTLLELRQAWDDLHLAQKRKADSAAALEDLFDQARLLDHTLPSPQPGLVSKLNLARLVAETGPWCDFSSDNKLLKFIGLNLFEKQSGRWRGKTKISKKGRPLARHVLSLIVIPLVRKGQLLGNFHHQKRDVEKKPGPVAITASARKILAILFGWGRSGRAFDPQRVFNCESQFQKAA